MSVNCWIGVCDASHSARLKVKLNILPLDVKSKLLEKIGVKDRESGLLGFVCPDCGSWGKILVVELEKSRNDWQPEMWTHCGVCRIG
jgi:hypothetical protein